MTIIQIHPYTNKISVIEYYEDIYDYDYPTRSSCTIPEIMAWLGTCFGYILAAVGVFKYFLSVLHTSDALGLIDDMLVKNYGTGLDWNFFGLMGMLTVLFELYVLALTFHTLIQEHHSIMKKIQDSQTIGQHYWLIINLIIALAAGLFCVGFFIICTMYHYILLAKYMQCVPNSLEALSILKNHSAIHFSDLGAYYAPQAENIIANATVIFQV